MTWLNGYRIRFVLVGFVAAVVLGGGSANADFIFGTPTNLGPTVNSSARDEEPGISADGLSLYYCSLRPGGYGNYDLWVTSRVTTEDDWQHPVNLGPTVNSSSADFTPKVSADGLMLYFVSDRPGGHGSYDLWVTRRATKQDDWGTPVNLGPTVNKAGMDACMAISDDGLELYFWSDRFGGYGSSDIWMTRRATIEEAWGMPVNLGPTVNSSATELCSDISADGLCLVFVSKRSGGYGGTYGDIWITRRATISDPWGPPVNLGPMVNTSASETGPAMSADGSTLYFGSDRSGGFGGWDIWQVSITPIVDFNGDGIVDLKDFSKLAQCWQQNESSVDIAPPIGNGAVDIEDVAVFAEHWLERAGPIALWKLDETEGTIAHDSIGDKDGTLYGQPLWQPAEGKIDGALQLDGIDDYVSVGFPFGPADLSFSIFAWVKGSEPGQVIISQINYIVGRTVQSGSTWLGTDSSDGRLITRLMNVPYGPLESEAVITDGEWHRVGLVYDFDVFCRSLYVDGAEVAKDENIVAGLLSAGSLRFGADKDLSAGSFFSGLIDDVRIYNRALSIEEIEEMAH